MLTTVMSCPTEIAWKAALHMCAYQYGARRRGIKFTKSDHPDMVCYMDASNKLDRKGRAIGGYVIHLCGGPIEWLSKKLPADQPGQSSHDCEYQEISIASKAVVWLRYLFEEMRIDHVFCPEPTKLYSDNDMATALVREDRMTTTNRFHAKNKHFSKKAFIFGHTDPLRVAGAWNPSDGLTKSLPQQLHDRHTPILTGHAVFDPQTACTSNAPPTRINTGNGPLSRTPAKAKPLTNRQRAHRALLHNSTWDTPLDGVRLFGTVPTRPRLLRAWTAPQFGEADDMLCGWRPGPNG